MIPTVRSDVKGLSVPMCFHLSISQINHRAVDRIIDQSFKCKSVGYADKPGIFFTDYFRFDNEPNLKAPFFIMLFETLIDEEAVTSELKNNYLGRLKMSA